MGSSPCTFAFFFFLPATLPYSGGVAGAWLAGRAGARGMVPMMISSSNSMSSQEQLASELTTNCKQHVQNDQRGLQHDEEFGSDR